MQANIAKMLKVLLLGIILIIVGVALQYHFSFVKTKTPTFGKVHNFNNPAIVRLDYQGGFVEYFISIDINKFESSEYNYWEPVKAEIFRRK